jgi:L-asparaginase
MKISRAIHVIATGGTIDSQYDGIKDTISVNRKSCVPDTLKGLNLRRRIKTNVVCIKNSRDLTEEDRHKLLETIEASSEKRVLVTHGTYTIVETATYLLQNLQRHDQTIILTGSLVPMIGFSPSDGQFNLGYSIAQLDVRPPGIYVCFSGNTHKASEALSFERRVKTTVGSSHYSLR